MGGSYLALKRHITQSKEDHLDRVHSDQNVLNGIRQGRLVLVIEGQDCQTNSRDHQPPVHLDQMVLVMARQETGLHRRKPAQGPHSRKLNSVCSGESWKTTLGGQET
jgi:hypothetical protein